MSDDKSNPGQDRKLISLTEDHDVRDWCTSLGCTESELHFALAKVGNSVEKVREFLSNKL